MNHRLFEAQVLAGGGTYTEISAVGLWKAYRQNRNSDEGSFLGFDVGGGYVFAHGAGAANHGLMAFAKLSLTYTSTIEKLTIESCPIIK